MQPVLILKNLIICSLHTEQYEATTKSKLQQSLGNLDPWNEPETICSVSGGVGAAGRASHSFNSSEEKT
jgi:hypothetical protein